MEEVEEVLEYLLLPGGCKVHKFCQLLVRDPRNAGLYRDHARTILCTFDMSCGSENVPR